MGEFILLSAQEQASGENVSSERVIREGRVEEVILAFCEELNPAYVVLGRPQEEQENNLLSNERLNDFADRITDVCQASVVLSS